MPQDAKFRYYTLLYLRCGDEILLGYKRRGFCSEQFHGFGGKLTSMETKEQCIIREMFEESKINIKEDELNFLGFTVHNEPAHIPRVVFIFTVSRNFKPEACETDEMTPQWFHVDKIPYMEMLPDNRYYLPHVLDNKLFRARFTLDPARNVYDSNIAFFECVEEVLHEFEAKCT